MKKLFVVVLLLGLCVMTGQNTPVSTQKPQLEDLFPAGVVLYGPAFGMTYHPSGVVPPSFDRTCPENTVAVNGWCLVIK